MSVGARGVTVGLTQIAVLGRPGRGVPPPTARPLAAPGIRLATFAVFGLYGTLRWGSLLSHGADRRLVGLLVLAVALAGARPVLARRSRILAALIMVVALIAVFPLSGVPLAWILHLRIALVADAIGSGLSALPGVLVPYNGLDPFVRLDIILGAALLMFDGALVMAFSPRDMPDLRRAGAALPLVALAAIPGTLLHPRFAYMDGLVLFTLAALFVWADRVGGRRAGGALALGVLAATLAMILAPALDRHRPWLDYQALAGSLAPKPIDTFDWSQGYGPITWPRRGRTVLEIQAARSTYWKAEDLDVFDGRAWTQGLVPGDQSQPAPYPSALARWSQTIQVTVRGMRTSNVIGAGVSQPPVGLSQVVSGFSSGTWTTGSNLGPGDSYRVAVYAPDPSPAQLSAAGADYSGLASGYRTVLLPPERAPGLAAATTPPQIVFPSFHSPLPVRTVVGPPLQTGAAIVERSPYGRAYALAQRLARGAATPYAFVLAVQHYLAHGFSYDESPPRRTYPLEGFLFRDRIGYCQQFAGAMALLLRMGGVPARVAVGFTSGRENAAAHRWLVTDSDAHAWVEAWFPHFGWMRLDPTPPSDPALGGRVALPSLAGAGGQAATRNPARRGRSGSALGGRNAAGAHPARHSGESAAWPPLIAALVLAIVGLLWLVTRPITGAEALVAELERAMARSGRPLPVEATLATIERRMGKSSAAGYVRSLRLARYAERSELPTPDQRRALRRQLAFGLGPAGALRALWALPPRRRPRKPRAGGPRATRAQGSAGS